MRRTGKIRVVLGSLLLGVGGQGCRGPVATGGAARGIGQGGAAVSAAEACARPMPDPALEVPRGHRLHIGLAAEGVQIYACAATPTGPAWRFQWPEATLRTADGAPAGRHSAGPTWEGLDGSTVGGVRVAGATPDPAAIPWLLLEASRPGGAGTFGQVTYIQRIATRGGLAPAAGCEAATVGALARVPYTASYCFHESGGQPPEPGPPTVR